MSDPTNEVEVVKWLWTFLSIPLAWLWARISGVSKDSKKTAERLANLELEVARDYYTKEENRRLVHETTKPIVSILNEVKQDVKSLLKEKNRK